MKEIKLSGISTRNKNHVVQLGNGHSRSFTSRKEAKRYLAQTGRYLTFKLHECNLIHAELYTRYRSIWFYLEHNKRSMSHALRATEHQCQRAFVTMINAMDMIIDRSGYENGNFFVFTHFKSIFSSMETVIADLQLLARGKSSGVEVHQLQAIYKKVQALQTEIDQYREPPVEVLAYEKKGNLTTYPLMHVTR